ncbi:MAG: hypothetical protein QNK04_11770 [Myxococcota bacterium]|nr:hypothetical protein [Myxococcota bacterium]
MAGKFETTVPSISTRSSSIGCLVPLVILMRREMRACIGPPFWAGPMGWKRAVAATAGYSIWMSQPTSRPRASTGGIREERRLRVLIGTSGATSHVDSRSFGHGAGGPQ